MLRPRVAVLAALLVIVPIHGGANAKATGHHHSTQHVGKSPGHGRKHSVGGKTTASAAKAASSTPPAKPKASPWARILRIGAWGAVIVGGLVWVGRRLGLRLRLVARQRQVTEDEAKTLKKSVAAWRLRAETAEAEVERSKGRIAELEQDNVQLRADRARATAIDQRFATLRDEISEITARLGGAVTEQAGSILDEHLARLMAARPGALATTPVLNRKERPKFWSILTWARDRNLKLLPQVSMGEYLNPASDDAKLRWTYNDRRTDFLVCDGSWNPILAVEHHGGGHEIGHNWEKRDAIKARALALADVGLVITVDDDEPDVVSAKLDAAYARVKANGSGRGQSRPARGGQA